MDNDEDNYQRRQSSLNTKLLQKHQNELTNLSFRTKQSVEIFPLPVVKTEKPDDSYSGDPSKEQSRVDRLPECEIQSIKMEPKIKISDAPADDKYHKSHMELSKNHIVNSSPSVIGSVYRPFVSYYFSFFFTVQISC